MLSKYDIFISTKNYDFLGWFDILRSPYFLYSDFVLDLFFTVDWFFEKIVHIPHHFDVSYGLHDDDLPF